MNGLKTICPKVSLWFRGKEVSDEEVVATGELNL